MEPTAQNPTGITAYQIPVQQGQPVTNYNPSSVQVGQPLPTVNQPQVQPQGIHPQTTQPQVIAPQVQPQTMVNPQVGPQPHIVNIPPSEMPQQERQRSQDQNPPRLRRGDVLLIVGTGEPERIHCPRCDRDQIPILTYIPGFQTWCWSCLLLIFFFPLFWLPFCCPPCMDPVYICPLDGTVLKRVVII